MKHILLTLYLSALSMTVMAADFKLSEFDPYTNYNSQFLELQLESEDGRPFDHIFSLLSLNNDDLSIRIIGSLPNETREELIMFYENEMPRALKKALGSSGNLHNPTVLPLASKLPEAFKTTKLFLDIEKELNQQGYIMTKIEFEKFTVGPNGISVPDIYIKCKKGPNKATVNVR